MQCFCADHPDHEKAIAARSYVHVREQKVFEVLKKAFRDYNWAFDRSYGTKLRLISERVTRLRPDARVHVADRVIIVEVDENSHKREACAKEREKEASSVRQAGRGNTVVMIRFNPDRYEDYNGKVHPTCFAQTTVNPKQQKQWDHRTQTLIDTIRYFADPDNELPPKQDERPCLMVELFYDNVSKTPEEERLAAEKKANKAISRGKRKAATAATANTGPSTPPTKESKKLSHA